MKLKALLIALVLAGIPNLFASYSVPNKSITQIKLANRSTGSTVGAGGLAISPSSGVFSTNSGSPVAVPNLSVTITTTGRPVLLLIQSAFLPGSGTSGYVFLNGTTVGMVHFYRDATQLCGIGLKTAATGNQQAYHGIQFIDTPAAGTYTYSVQVESNGSGFIGASDVELVAYEL